MKSILVILSSFIIIILSSGCSTKYVNEPTLIKKLQGTTVSDHFIFIDKYGDMRDVNDSMVINYKKKIDNIYSKFDKL
ncbi:hypothetical protein GSY74_06115, partial [Sulfurovum sp. bin170]|uniref:hypothetical protein n=1 Tax=Sulfurovum sp. bin170 TaxID=2695268 RepID=UPI0013DF705D